MEAETELPRNAVRRLVKGKLDALAAGAEANFSVNKEVRGPGRRGCRCGRFPPPRGGFALSRLRGRAGLRAGAPLAGLPGGSGQAPGRFRGLSWVDPGSIFSVFSVDFVCVFSSDF